MNDQNRFASKIIQKSISEREPNALDTPIYIIIVGWNLFLSLMYREEKLIRVIDPKTIIGPEFILWCPENR